MLERLTIQFRGKCRHRGNPWIRSSIAIAIAIVAVDAAYLARTARKGFRSDAERMAFLFELYRKYTSLLLPVAPPKSKRARKAAGKASG